MKYLTIEKQNHISLLTLNRPEKHNAFHLDFLTELEETIRSLGRDETVRLLIITGAGEKSFSSGVDLSALVEFESIEQARSFALQLESTMSALLCFPKPVIAAINGYAFGGGFGLASNADVRILAESAKIGFPAVRLGAILPVGCTLRLNALIGSGRSRELLLSGRIVDADEALQTGLVNEVVSKDSLLTRAYEIAKEILKGSDLALEMTKQLTNQELLVQMEQYSLSAAENFAYLAFTEEWKQRIQAFMKKQKKR
jgi:enoyl-CoA hydratase